MVSNEDTVDTTNNSDFSADFEKVDSGASLFVPISISDVKKGSHINIDGRPCKVLEITTSKTGKHGHAKANILCVDIFNGRKHQDVAPVSHSKEEPTIVRKEYTIMSMDDEGYVSMIDKTGNMRQDLKLPDETDDDKEIAKRITNGLNDGKTMMCTVLAAMNIEKIEDAKESTEN
jgi:translation initiation factor 5A